MPADESLEATVEEAASAGLDTIENLVARLGILLSREPHLRTASQFNLETALRAAELAGVGETLTIEIPRNTSGLVDVRWAAGEPGAPRS